MALAMTARNDLGVVLITIGGDPSMVISLHPDGSWTATVTYVADERTEPEPQGWDDVRAWARSQEHSRELDALVASGVLRYAESAESEP